MTKSVPRSRANTKRRVRTNVTHNRTDVTHFVQEIHPIITLVREKFGAEKAVRQLQLLTISESYPEGLSESYCRKVLQGRREINFELITALLAQDWGKDVLHLLVPDASWVGKHKRLLTLDELNRRQIEIERNIKAALLSEAEQ